MDAYNSLQMRTFQDLLDLTKASDVLQWLSPDTTTSSTNGTEPILWQGDTVTRAPSSYSNSFSVSGPPRTHRQHRTTRRRLYTPRVRRQHLQRAVGRRKKDCDCLPQGLVISSARAVGRKKIVPVCSSHEHEAWIHVQLERTAAA